jgi:hypothetical protein
VSACHPTTDEAAIWRHVCDGPEADIDTKLSAPLDSGSDTVEHAGFAMGAVLDIELVEQSE